MRSQLAKKTRAALTAACCALLLAACSDDGRNPGTPNTAPPPDITFEIQVTNLTGGQPLSPIAVVAHTDAYRLFNLGDSASAGLELMAEAGDNSDLIAEAEAEAAVLGTVSGAAPLPPGGTETLMLTTGGLNFSNIRFSVASMLVNTNDAITAVNGADATGMAVNDSLVVNLNSYDSGTEANSEAAGTIPGPADGGEGFNAARDDLADRITAHPGVISADDGLAGSVLSHAHRWDNPVARVRITRIE